MSLATTEFVVNYAGNAAFTATIGNHHVVADQPAPTGDGKAPTPSEYFLFSLAACTGHYLVQACKRSGIDPQGVAVKLTAQPATQPSRYGKITLQCQIPPNLTDDQRLRLRRAAEACFVHNTIAHHPEIGVELVEQAMATV